MKKKQQLSQCAKIEMLETEPQTTDRAIVVRRFIKLLTAQLHELRAELRQLERRE